MNSFRYNPVDWKIREGFFKTKAPYQFPLILGWDAAGVITRVGRNVKNLKVGDAVFAYCRKPIVQLGTYAEFICYPAEQVALKPSSLSFAQAAALPLVSLTAWQSLFNTAQLKKGEKVLIQAGARGVGSLAIQLAKQMGAYVITTASASNHDYVKGLGADLIIDCHHQPVEQEVKKVAPDGIDVILDTVGGEVLKNSFTLLKKGGRCVSIVEPIDPSIDEKLSIRTFFTFVSPNGKELQNIANLIREQKIYPIEVQEMPLDQAAEAQNQSQQRHVRGKIVLKVQET